MYLNGIKHIHEPYVANHTCLEIILLLLLCVPEINEICLNKVSQYQKNKET